MSFGFSVGDLITVLNLANKIRKRFVDSPNQFGAISNEVKGLSNILRDLEDALPQRNLTDSQKANLADIEQACENVLRDLDKVIDTYCTLDTNPISVGHKSRKLWKRLRWEPDDMKDLRLRIVSNITALNAFDGSLIREPITRLDKYRDDKERRTITDWLSSMDFSSQQCDYFTKSQDGTGQWLLDSAEFKAWLDEAGQTLFCPGMPGAGKTIITSIVIDSLWRTFQAGGDIGVAFLYCNYKRKQEQTFENLLASLLQQLVQERHILPDEVKSLYKCHVDRKTRPSSKEFITALETVISSYSRVFIIIDALDECASTDRQQLLKEVFSFQNQAQVNIFATSRFDTKIQFNEGKYIEIRASKEDVERYLKSQMHHLPTCVMKNPTLQREIATEITKAFDGMFLLAQLHLDSLKNKITAKAVRLALQNLPKGLDTAYNEAIERIEAQASDHLELAKKVLSWVTCTRRPLNVIELQHALAVETGETELDKDNIPEVEDMASVCAGLVVIDEDSNVIRLVHYTTQIFFEQFRLSWIPNSQTDISKTCLTYLSFDVFSVGFCSSDKQLEALLHENIFLDYASRFWGFHTREASIDCVEPSLRAFFDRESNMCCSSQILMVPEYRYYGYSQQAPMQVSTTHLAAYFGLEEILPLVSSIVHLTDRRDSNGQTPLSWAATYGHEAVVKLLLARNDVEADSRDENGRSPLSWAAMKGHEAVVKLLLARNDVEADSRDKNGTTPLSWEAMSGHETVVKLLLARNDVEADSRDKYGTTPLFLAAMNGHEAVVKLLLARNDVEADSRDENGRSPLSWAAMEGHEAVVKLLLARNDVEADPQDNTGRSPLSYAAEKGKEAVVKVLVVHKDVKVHSPDLSDRTPLSYAVGPRLFIWGCGTEEEYEAVIKLLKSIS